jgi:hypothetical protein
MTNGAYALARNCRAAAAGRAAGGAGAALPPKPSPKPAAKPATTPAVALPPKKPAALTAQQKTVEAQQKKAAAEAEKKAAAAAAAEKRAAALAETKAAAEQKKIAAAAQPKTPGAKKNGAKPANKQEAAKYALTDYFRVWDISGDTTRAEIVARFGEPQRTGDSERKPFYYFNGTLTFFFTAEDTVGTMIVGNSFEPIPKDAIPAEVLDKAFIGRKRDDVLKTFGPASVVSSDNYRYLPKTGVYKVEFQCYDFKGTVCGQLLVQF